MPKDIKKDIQDILAAQGPQITESDNTSMSAADPEMQSEIDRMSQSIDNRKQYDKPLAAAAAGLLRGATLNLSDPILTKTGLVKPETLKGLEEENPIISGGSEFVGTGIGILAPTGPVSAVTKAGLGIEAAVAAKLATNAAERAVVKRIAAKAAAATAAGAAEGAAYGAGNLISEEALGDADFNAQNLLSATGIGAVLGGVIGGVFGTSFGAAEEVGKLFSKDGKLKRSIVRELDEQSNAIDLVAPQGAERARLERLAQEGTDGGQKIDFANYIRNDLDLKTMTTRSDLYRKNLEVQRAAADEISSVAKTLDDYLSETPILANQFKKKIVDQVKSTLKYETENPRVFSADIKKLESRIEKEFFVGSKSKIEKDAAAAIAPEGLILSDIVSAKKPAEKLTPSKIFEFFSRIGKEAFDSSKPELEKTVLSKAWGATKDSIKEMIEQSGDAELAAAWAEANRKFQISKLIDKPLSLRAAADAPLVGFKDALLGTTAAALGGPTAAAAAIASKRFLESDLKKKLIVLHAAEKTSRNAVQNITNSVANFFTSAAKSVKKSAIPEASTIFQNSGFSQDFTKPNKPKAAENDIQAFKNMSKNIAEYSSNPEKLAKRLAISTSKLDYVAPNIAQKTREGMVRAVDFLADKLPKDRNQPFDLFQSQREFVPSTQVLAKFKRYVQVVEDPYSVLKDLESGTATQEHIEALKVVYPSIYNKIRTEALNYVIKNPTDLDFNKKAQLAILLQAPVIPSMQGKAIANLQSTYIPEEKPESGGAVKPTVTGLSELSIAQSEATNIDKIASGTQS